MAAGGNLEGARAAISARAESIDVFDRGREDDNHLHRLSYKPSRRRDVVDLGGGRTPTSLCIVGGKRIDRLCKGDDTEPEHRSWDGETLDKLGKNHGAGIQRTFRSVVSRDKNRIDVVALGVDGQLVTEALLWLTESS